MKFDFLKRINEPRCFSLINSSFFSVSVQDQVTKIIRPVVRKIHPDLYYKLNNSKIPLTNKECIQNLSELWTKICHYEKHLPFPFLVGESENDKEANTEFVRQKISSAIESRKKVEIGFDLLFKTSYCLTCFHFPSGTESVPLKNEFEMKIPPNFTQLSSFQRNKIDTGSPYMNFLKEFHLVLSEQEKFYTVLGIEFPLSQPVGILRKLLESGSTLPSDPQSLSRDDTLPEDIKMSLFEAFATQSHYRKKTQAYKYDLQHRTQNLLRKLSVTPTQQENSKSKIVKAPFLLRPGTKTKSVEDEINYFLMGNHIRFENAFFTDDEQLFLLLSLKQFLLKFSFTINFTYQNYSQIYLYIYMNESKQDELTKKTKDLQLFQRINSDNLFRMADNLDTSSNSRDSFSILRIPHNFHPSVLVEFLTTELTASDFTNSTVPVNFERFME
jgi:hypothetical protein